MQSAHVLNSQSPWAMGLFWISSKVMSNENDRYVFRKEVNRIPSRAHH
jgi:hypothetical protein